MLTVAIREIVDGNLSVFLSVLARLVRFTDLDQADIHAGQSIALWVGHDRALRQ
jgi:hypothetical protein